MAPARELVAMGFSLVATRGTAHGAGGRRACRSRIINKVLEGRPHVVDALKNGEIHLVFNTTEGAQALADSLVHPAHRADPEGALLHHHGGGRGRHQAIAALQGRLP